MNTVTNLVEAVPCSRLKTCARCVMDTTVPEIHFDGNGECQYCKMHDFMDGIYPRDPVKLENKASQLVDRIRQVGKGKRYDCIVGVSGGRDSTWGLYRAVKAGLRPLAVHFDNGWNSPIAVSNIANATNHLGIDLETVVADWEEFRDLQVSFLRASVPDVEIPTDVAIHSVLHRIAAREDVQYVFFCHSFRTEGIVPRGWSFLDGKYIEAVQKRFGTRPLKDFKNFKIWDFFRFSIVKGIQSVPFVNYFDYNQKKVSELLTNELGWKYYGGHHHESTYTFFIQSYLLPRKFNIDKRKAEYSALVRSGQMDRQTALQQTTWHPYEYDEKLLAYVLSKLEITKTEWNLIWNSPIRSYQDFPSYYPLMKRCRLPLKLATSMGWLPELLYLKYLE
ncbi:MAG: N-acetyl sugar amidotransferase [Deltaproteobacteria bacterium]|nr:N-acetyl sugar amidotransferase [Deltaproteobacteria bacterium]